jgi:hypothetical protein
VGASISSRVGGGGASSCGGGASSFERLSFWGVWLIDGWGWTLRGAERGLGGRINGCFNENVYMSSVERLLGEYGIHRDLTSIPRDLTTNRLQALDLHGCVTHCQTRKMGLNEI